MNNQSFRTFLVAAFLVLSVRTQTPSENGTNLGLSTKSPRESVMVTAISSFWTLITQPVVTTANPKGGNDPCRITGSVQLAGDASSTNSYYVYRNLYQDTRQGSVIGRLDFASGRPDLVILSRMQNDRSVIGWDRTTRNFNLLRPLKTGDGNSTGQETQVVFRCMPRDNTNMVYYIFYLFNVIDVNDNKPTFTKPYYRVQLSEAAPVGTVVSNDVLATDGDSNSQLSYWIQDGPDASYFAIDTQSGQVTVAHPLDYEFVPSANLTIWVKDTPTWCDLHERPCVVYSASTTLSIQVIDVDDQPPVFTAPIYYGSIAANASYGTLVSFNQSVLATDGDIYISIPVVYALTPTFLGREDLDDDPRPYMMINERTAEIYVVRPLPSTVDELVYTVKASQLNNSAKSAVAMVRIAISKHYIRFLGRSRFEIDVVEAAAPRSRIFYAPVMSDAGGSLSFSIYGRDPIDTSLLAIDSQGIVTFTRALTYSRQKNRIAYIITAMDVHQQSATAELVINIQPTFGRLPRFGTDRFVFNASNREPGTVVGRAELDGWDESDPNRVNFTYALNADEGMFRIDQQGVIRIAQYLTSDKKQLEFMVTALDSHRMGDSAIVVVILPIRIGSSIELTGTTDMSNFLVYILAAIAAILMSVVLALGVYLLRSEKQIREMQRRILGTTIDSDSHVKWLHGGGPSTSSGELGPVDPAILRTNEAYQRFLEGGSSEEVQSSGAESLEYGRSGRHGDRDKMLQGGGHHVAGGVSSGYASSASPPVQEQLAMTINSGLPNHHPFTPQTPPVLPSKKQQQQHQQQQQQQQQQQKQHLQQQALNRRDQELADNFTAMASMPSNGLARSSGNLSSGSQGNLSQIANGKRRYKKKYENPMNADYGLEPFDDGTSINIHPGDATLASPTSIGLDLAQQSAGTSKGGKITKLPPLPPKPRLGSSSDEDIAADLPHPSQQQRKGSKFLDSVFGRFLPTASSMGHQSQAPHEEIEHPAPPIPPPLSNLPSAAQQYSMIVEHGMATTVRRVPGSHYMNDAIFVPPPSLPLPSMGPGSAGATLAANAVNRYLLDGRTIAY